MEITITAVRKINVEPVCDECEYYVPPQRSHSHEEPDAPGECTCEDLADDCPCVADKLYSINHSDFDEAEVEVEP